jgi:ElaB/YqjD/DUF883 family membrane-anchored ribosome-binding protein
MAAKEKLSSAKHTVEKTMALAKKSASAQVDALVKLEHKAEAEVKSAAKSTGKMAKQHPVAAAGVLLGAGALLGAVAHAAFGHKPTVRETMMDALRSSKKRVAKQVNATRRAMR